MFTIEHGFDSSTITLIDEGNTPLSEDITIHAFEDCVTVEQLCPRTDTVQRVSFSIRQIRELARGTRLARGDISGRAPRRSARVWTDHTIRKSLSREVSPRNSTNRDFGTPSALASNLMTATLALPSSGIAVT